MTSLAAATAVVLLSLALFAVGTTEALLLKSIWQSLTKNNGMFNNAANVQNDMIVRPNFVQQNDIVRPNFVQQNDIVRPNFVQQNDMIVRPNFVQQDAVGQNVVQTDPNGKSMFVDGSSLDFFYWNSYLGNGNPIRIEFGNEKLMIHNWLWGKPLKVITHGWLGADTDGSGVFAIKTAYVAVGGYNVITADWNRVASNIMYPMPAYLTTEVGSVIARLLENLVNLGAIDPSDIHVIGHSLGAHVSGACGAAFGPGGRPKIGRISGLDPAGPGFEYVALRSDSLDSTDAEFVDVIHTASGTAGYSKSIGHVDFYPNAGTPPQPGCLPSYTPTALAKLVGCSHSRAHQFYADSVYHRNSLIAVMCPSWDEFVNGGCNNNTKSPMGHDADPKARGDFYMQTNPVSPYGISDAIF